MIYNGNSLMLFTGDTTSNSAEETRSIGFATNHQISFSQELKDIAHKDANSCGGRWAVSSYGTVSWEITTDAFLGDTSSTGESASNSEMKREGRGALDMFKLFNERKPIFVVFGLEGASKDFFNDATQVVPEGGWKPKGNSYFSGWAYISSLNISAPTNDYATWSLTLTGTGALTLVEEETAEWMSAKEPVPVIAATTTAKKTVEKQN